MEVQVEETGQLSRHLRFVIPAIEVNKKLERRLREVASRSRLDGFRPGKAPMKIIKSRYQGKALHEVALETMETSYRQAVKEHDLDAAAHNFIETDFAIDRDSRFTVAVELFPRFDPVVLDGEEIEEYRVSIDQDDINRMMDLARKNHADWRPVERPAQKDDRVYTAFVHAKEARRFIADRKNSVRWLLDGAGMSPAMERCLLGAQAGETIVIPLAPPPGERSAQQPKGYEMRVERVEESCLPPLNDDFYRRIGAADGREQTARNILREGMEHEIESRKRRYIHDTLIERLLEKNDVAAPPTLIKQEFDRICLGLKRQFGLDRGSQAFPGEDSIRERAEKNVRWALISKRLIEKHRLKPNQERVEEEISQLAARYEDPPAARRYFRQNQRALATIIDGVMQEQIVALVLATMKKTPSPRAFGDFMEKTSRSSPPRTREDKRP